MMFALNYMAVCSSLKSSVSNFLIHIKSQWKRGARGEEPRRRLSAVPSPGHKKNKGFFAEPRDSKIFNATRSPFLPANFPYLNPPSSDGFRRPEATSAPQAPRENENKKEKSINPTPLNKN